MKITIKNQEYKLLHNIPKGTRLMYNDEECVKVGKINMLVGIETGQTYMLPPTKKIYMDIKRERSLISRLHIGDFFVYKKELYVLLGSEDRISDYRSEVLNLNTQKVTFIFENVEVESVEKNNIQIKVK